MAGITRRCALNVFFLSLVEPLSACGKGNRMGKSINLDVVLYSFLDRPIFDILLNGTVLGVSGPYGGTSVVTGVTIPFGPQKLTWRLDGPPGKPRNGETVTLKNHIAIQPDQIPADTFYMGVYLYPDHTAEIAFTEYIPTNSKRGESIFEERKIRR